MQQDVAQSLLIIHFSLFIIHCFSTIVFFTVLHGIEKCFIFMADWVSVRRVFVGRKIKYLLVVGC